MRPGNPAKIAVEDFQDGKDVNYRLPSEIRDKLAEAGFDVLDRSVIEHAAAEHEFEKSGLATGNLTSLLGADYLVRGQIDGENFAFNCLMRKKGGLLALWI